FFSSGPESISGIINNSSFTRRSISSGSSMGLTPFRAASSEISSDEWRSSSSKYSACVHSLWVKRSVSSPIASMVSVEEVMKYREYYQAKYFLNILLCAKEKQAKRKSTSICRSHVKQSSRWNHFRQRPSSP